MPICPRCGKSLSTDQSLCYHLNKRRRCDSLKCQQCNILFDSTYRFKIHIANCHSSLTCENNLDVCSTSNITCTTNNVVSGPSDKLLLRTELLSLDTELFVRAERKPFSETIMEYLIRVHNQNENKQFIYYGSATRPLTVLKNKNLLDWEKSPLSNTV
jgi:uncharacterized C2H2 Zn-finger protein